MTFDEGLIYNPYTRKSRRNYSMGSLGSRHDPIADRYDFITKVESIITFLFFVAFVASVVTLVSGDVFIICVSKLIFVVLTLIIFVAGNVIKFSLFPKAEEARLHDFFSKAYQTNTCSEGTNGYYNNGEGKGYKSISSQLLENLLFTKEISKKMLKRSRFMSISALIFIAALFSFRINNMGLSIDWLTAITFAIFSEEVLIRAIRLEYLNRNSNVLYDDVYRAIKSPQEKAFQQHAYIIEKNTAYEKLKSNAATTLNTKIFHEINPTLSMRWEEIKAELDIKQ